VNSFTPAPSRLQSDIGASVTRFKRNRRRRNISKRTKRRVHRLFVALRPPPPVREALIDLADGVAAARWQNDDQLHLTLRFIGSVERHQAEDIADALAQIAAPAPTIALDGVGRFGNRGGDALWAGVSPHDALHHLHRKVDHACVRAGLAPERRAFLPHITLARLPRSAAHDPEVAGWVAAHAGVTSAPFTMTHLLLYESHLGRAGAHYEAVARWPLDGHAALGG
jgi:2'-5' RNA ligase